MGIGVGGYPEKHPQAPSLEVDLQNLKRKVDAGADAIFTQLFFDNAAYFRFRDHCQRLGIAVPVVPGIIPLTNPDRLRRMEAMTGVTVPSALLDRPTPGPRTRAMARGRP